MRSIGSVSEREVKHNVLLGGGVKEGKDASAIQHDGSTILDPVRDIDAADLIHVR